MMGKWKTLLKELNIATIVNRNFQLLLWHYNIRLSILFIILIIWMMLGEFHILDGKLGLNGSVTTYVKL